MTTRNTRIRTELSPIFDMLDADAAKAGRQARLAGKAVGDNPHIIGRTKLGAVKLSESGIAWEQGFNSIGRVVSETEMHAAQTVDVSRFRRKANRYYGKG